MGELDVGVLWLHRPTGAGESKPGLLQRRPAEKMVPIAQGYLKARVYWERSGVQPQPSPTACHECPVTTCLVRAMG